MCVSKLNDCKSKENIYIKLKIFPVIFLIYCLIISCTAEPKKTSVDYSSIRSFHEIPGITLRETSAINALQRDKETFIYGITPSTETFVDLNGDLKGYAALYCDWLTRIFRIKFDIKVMEWFELKEALNKGEVDFSIHFLTSDENLENYFMTDPIAERQFIISYIEGVNIDQIRYERKPRFAFTTNSPTESSIALVLGRDSYESVWIDNYDEVYAVLKNGEADALITTRAAESNFIAYNDMIQEDFFPLTYSTVSMITANPGYKVIIDVINKALRDGAISYLNSLYTAGYNEYKQYKFLSSLNEEEKEYLRHTVSVPAAVQYFNYPIVFYDNYKKKWDGIAFELLNHIKMITGLSFEVINDKNTEMQELIQLLRDGKAHVFSDLVYSGERAQYFIWGDYKFMPDQYALLSKIEFPNVTLNEIPYKRIALINNTAHAEMYRIWFPGAENTINYDVADDAFYALEKGDVDMVMAAKSKLLYYSNYFEFSGYKANYLFNYFYESAFAYNKDQKILRSIMDKALSVIDTNIIVEQWLTRTYDYQAQLMSARLPWVIGAVIMSALIVVLVLIIFLKSRRQAFKLQREHQRTRIMLDTLPIACFVGTINGKIYDCNKEALRLFKLNDKQEFIDRFDHELSPEYQPNGKSSYDELIRYGVITQREGKCVFDWMHQQPDGTPLPTIVTLESVIFGGEKALIAYIRDRREYTQMTTEINRQNRLLKTVNTVSSILLEPDISHFDDTLYRSMSILAEITGVDRICIWKNSKESKWLRFSLGYQWDLDGLKSQVKNGSLAPDFWLSDHPEWHEILTQGNYINSLLRDTSRSVQTELLPRNIKSILIVPIFLEDHFWGFFGFDRCINEKLLSEGNVLILRSASRMMANAVIRNEMAAELVYSKERAEDSNRSKSIFLSHMSHEIRTPMNAILGITEIQMRDENLLPDTMEAFSKIYESGDLLLNIINDILDLSKIESGRLEISPIRYDMPSLINDTVQLNRLRYDSKAIDFFLHVDKDTPVNLLGDELRIKQILNNILSNAYKYTDSGKIDFYISAEYAKDRADDDVTLVFNVSDTGQGMNKDQVSRVFVEYSRFNLEKNRTTVGAGLGMSITKRLIDLMEGTIEIISEPDKGSAFIIRLPQKQVGETVCGSELAEKLANFHFQNTTILKKTRFLREYMPYGSVLVVDDVDSNIYVTKGMLLPYGLNIETAISGFEAIEKVKNGNVYDIIFMDHMMPKMDGVETTKILREMGYNNPIIALTANAIIGREEMFLRNGFDGFVSKPIDSRELNLYLNDFIRNKKPPEVVEAARNEQIKKGVINIDKSAKDSARSTEMAELFIIDAANAVKMLEKFDTNINNLENEDMALYIITVHGMKTALANIGEKEISGIALKLEMAGEERDISELTNTTPLFINSLKSLIEKYKSKIKNESAENINVDKNYLREKLNEIKTACAAFDKNTSKAALQELKSRTWPADINMVLDEIAINILHSAFKKVVTVIEDYFNSI